MDSMHDAWKYVVSRALIVSGSGMILGFILYQFLIFTPTMKPSQFTFSSINIGITYAALKSHSPRNGLAALFVWYIIATTVFVQFNWWLLILNVAYIAGMACAVFILQRVVNTRLAQGSLQRIVLAGAVVSVTNALIVIVLTLFSLRVLISHASSIMETIFYNLQIGALIGLATGIGMELAEYLTGRFFAHRTVAA